jgi:hypothetical protein|tara:strand:- start:835 stop:1044 length:210 start_codon:yes stop_codon:yes gene_type:complete
MYVIVLVLIQMGQHKVASDQVLYPTMDACEISRILLAQRLEDSRPTKDSFTFSKCTMISFEEHKSKVTL